MNCQTCGGANCTHIVLTPASGRTVELFSCRDCETRWWRSGGEDIALEQVLELAAER